MSDDNYNGPDRRSPDDRWHLKKEIQVPHIISTVILAVTLVMYAGKIEQRIAIMEQWRLDQHERDDRQDKQLTATLETLNLRLGRMEDKMDRAIERKGDK